MLNALADRWLPKYMAAVHSVLRRQALSVTGPVEVVVVFLESVAEKWTTEMMQVKWRWLPEIAERGYRATMKGTGGKARKKAELVIQPKKMVIREKFNYIDRWVRETAKSETKTFQKKLIAIFRRATELELTPTQIAKKIMKEKLVASKTSAELIARTGTIWAVNEGAQLKYKEEGVVAKEWLTTEDDVTCAFCMAMNGEVVRTQDAFWDAGDALEIPQVGEMKLPFRIEHPPLHPRCRCALLPVA